MKNSLLIICCVVFFSAYAHTRDEKLSDNKYVQCTIVLGQKQVKAGARAHLLITLKPSAGIHINGTPSVEVKLDSSELIAAVGKLDIPLTKKSGYLNTAKQIKLPLTFSKNVKSGAFPIKGMLIYYYCSDAEGWCSRFKQPITLTATIVQ